MLGAKAFATELKISEERLMQLLEKYPDTFHRVTRIMGLPRFDVTVWTPVVKNLLTTTKGHEKSKILPPLSNNDDDEKGNGTSSDVITYGESRATRELYTARTAKLDYLRRAGRMIEVASVVRAWKDIAISVQKAVLAVPDRVAPLCSGEQDITVIRNRFRSELLYALKNLSFTIAATENDIVETPISGEKKKGTVKTSNINPKKAGRKRLVDR